MAVKYGYDSPDSFAKAFQRFHGIKPSQAREPGASLRSLAPLYIKITMERDDSFSAKVRSALTELLPGGAGTVEEVSAKLGVSKRTLQRKLMEENTSFQKQLNGTRELLAKHYIRNTEMGSDEIAFLLGYQELNSFLRAFSLWTGMSISEYRRGQD